MKASYIIGIWLSLVAILPMSLVGGCGIFHKYVEDPNADGVGLPDEEIGRLEWGFIFNDLQIDGKVVIPWKIGHEPPAYELGEREIVTFARLRPGPHKIYVDDTRGENKPIIAMLILEVEAGHRYRLYTDGCYFCGNVRGKWRSAVWIKDQKTGKVVAGKPPDWFGSPFV